MKAGAWNRERLFPDIDITKNMVFAKCNGTFEIDAHIA